MNNIKNIIRSRLVESLFAEQFNPNNPYGGKVQVPPPGPPGSGSSGGGLGGLRIVTPKPGPRVGPTVTEPGTPRYNWPIWIPPNCIGCGLWVKIGGLYWWCVRHGSGANDITVNGPGLQIQPSGSNWVDPGGDGVVHQGTPKPDSPDHPIVQPGGSVPGERWAPKKDPWNPSTW